MAKWSKSYPEAADRFAVSIADTDSPTGFSWASKTDAEVKSLLGLYTGKFAIKLQVTTDDEGTVTVAKSVPVINTESFTATFARSGVGVYTCTIPVSSTYKRLVKVFFDTYQIPEFAIERNVSASALVTIQLYKNGVLADPDLETAIGFYLELGWY